MSEPAPPSEPADPADGVAQALSAEAIDRLLADFRGWLHEHPEPAAPAEPAFDLSALVAPFVALRHEVNLQTKASRAQLDQNAQALEQLRQAVDALRRPAAPTPPSADDALRPVLKTLIDVHDALALARREVLRLRDSLPADAAPPTPPPAVGFWTRWLGLAPQAPPAEAPDLTPRLRQMVEAMRVGYDMGVQRLDRAIEQHGLERIACVGEPFDPETMEVAEVVRDPARGSTEVIDELRPGYRWRGRLLRYAQVRVAKP